MNVARQNSPCYRGFLKPLCLFLIILQISSQENKTSDMNNFNNRIQNLYLPSDAWINHSVSDNTSQSTEDDSNVQSNKSEGRSTSNNFSAETLDSVSRSNQNGETSTGSHFAPSDDHQYIQHTTQGISIDPATKENIVTLEEDTLEDSLTKDTSVLRSDLDDLSDHHADFMYPSPTKPTSSSMLVKTRSSRSPNYGRSTTSVSTVDRSQNKDNHKQETSTIFSAIASGSKPTDDNKQERSSTVTATTGGSGAPCEEFRNFTKMLNICDPLKDLESYQSCKGRCGIVLPYVIALETCSCDKNCLKYGDCCIDFSYQCPVLFSSSQREPGAGSYTFCKHLHEMPINVIYRCATGSPMVSKSTNNYYSTPSVPPSTTIPERSSSDWINVLISGLAHYSQSYTVVADQLTGLVYSSLESYHQCNELNDSMPYFIPYVLPLEGSYVDGESIESYVFPHSPDFYYNPYILQVDPVFRACLKDEIIHCSECAQPVTAKVSQVCHWSSRTIVESGHHHVDWVERGARLNYYGSCSHFPPLMISTYYWKTQSIFTNYAFLVYNISMNWFNARREYENNVQSLGAMVTIKRESLITDEYVLEFNGAPWKRMLCSNPYLRLDDCQVDECNSGYLKLKENRCFKPNVIEVHTETNGTQKRFNKIVTPQYADFCTCLSVYAAFQDTKMWELGKLKRQQSSCEYEIKKSVHREDQTRSDNINVLREKLLSFLQQELDCREQFHNIIICFKNLLATNSPCFKIAFDEIKRQPELDTANSGHQSRRLTTPDVLTLAFVLIYCTHLM